MDLQGGGGGIFVAICSSEGLVTLDAIPPPPPFSFAAIKTAFPYWPGFVGPSPALKSTI